MTKKVSMKEKYGRQAQKNFLAHARNAPNPKYFLELNNAIAWVEENNGGKVLKRNAKVETVEGMLETTQAQVWGLIYASPQ